MSGKAIGVDIMRSLLAGAAEAIKANHTHLSQLDAAVGDGDHGAAMLRVAQAISKAVEGKGDNLKTFLSELAWAVMSTDGGSTSPLFGSLFLGMSEAVGEETVLDCSGLASMFEAGLAKVQTQTKAQVGDKTLLDALIPAVKAIREGAETNLSIEETLGKAAEAAAQGAESTKNLRAAFGRAKNLGDRTLGHADPGAMSIAYIFAGLKDAFRCQNYA